MRWSLRRFLPALGSALLALCLGGGFAAAQVLNLGDPEPPPPAHLAAARSTAASLRAQAQRLRQPAHRGSTEAHLAILDAQAKWRDLAALLLELPNPMNECEAALLGWRLATSAAALDADLARLADAPELDVEASEDCVWMLRRFNAATLPEADAGDPEALAPVVELLCEALAPLAPDCESTLKKIDSLRARLDNDSDLRRAAEWLDRAATRPTTSRVLAPRDRAALSRLERVIAAVESLDRSAWLGSVWASNRARTADEAIGEALGARASAARPRLEAIEAIAGAVRRLEAHAQRPPSDRLRAGDYQEAARRWARLALEEGAAPPWKMMYDALDSAAARRADADAAGQRELRIVCKALDDQSDRLEGLIGESLLRISTAQEASDPAWATLIGGHRRNVIERRMLVDLPANIDTIALSDPRAPAALWPRLSAAAMSIENERSRDQLVALARAISDLAPSRTLLEVEAAWRDEASWAADLLGAERRAVMERLDALRTVRAAELVNDAAPFDAAPTDAARDLAALADLFRLAAAWRALDAAGRDVEPLALRLNLLCPESLGAQAASVLKAEIQRAAAAASRGGAPFRRAVEQARRSSAEAIVLADLLRRAESLPVAERAAHLEALHRLACLEPDGAAAGERARLAQWNLLHLESADPLASAAVAACRNHLAQRLADAIWMRRD